MPDYGLGGTFDLARAYAQAQDVKGAQQTSTLRDLQIQAAQRDLAKPETISPEETLQHAHILRGLTADLMNDSSDEAVNRVAAVGLRSGTITPADVAAFKALPLDQRQASAKQLFDQADVFVKNAEDPKAAGAIKRSPLFQVWLERGGDPNDTAGFAKFYDEQKKMQLQGQQRQQSYTYGQTAEGFVGLPTLGGAPVPVTLGGKPVIPATANPSLQGGIAESKATGGAEAERTGKYIDAGLAAADALAITNRGIQLLDEVKTGGIEAVKLKATNMFGVTGADEAELSANLGKAVLAQLRSTFGAQFTEQEGERLSGIEAGFGKSTEGNKRLLQQASKILDRAARRGLAAAQKANDEFSANEIRKSMATDLSKARGAVSSAPPAAIEYLKQHPEFSDQFKAKYGYLP